MQNINLYKEFQKKSGKKYIYSLVAVLALGSLVLSQLVLPINASAFYDELYSGDQYDGWYGGDSGYDYGGGYDNGYDDWYGGDYGYYDYGSGYSDDYSDWYSGNDYGQYASDNYFPVSGYSNNGYTAGDAYDFGDPYNFGDYVRPFYYVDDTYGYGNNGYNYGYSDNYTTPGYYGYDDSDYNYGGFGGYNDDSYFDSGFDNRFVDFDNFRDFQDQDIEIINNNINENIIDVVIDERPRVEPFVLIQNPNLRVDKEVRNLTSGLGFSKSADALVGDRVRFEIEVQNTGDIRLHNVLVGDSLDSRLEFISGTLFIGSAGRSGPMGSAGVNVGDLAVGETIVIVFDAQVLGGQGQTLSNTAFARADEAAERNDTARVHVNIQPVVVPLPVIVNDLFIAKHTRNVSAGQTALVGLTDAAPNDLLHFTIEVRPVNASAFLQNIRIKDDLPVGLNYVSNSTRVNNSFVSDGLTTSGINIGSLSGGQSKFIDFEARAGSLSNTQNLTNIARASADGVPERSASAQVRLAAQAPLPAPPLAQFPLRKTVENLSFANGTLTENNALAGDTLKYSLSFQNTGNAALVNAQILDVLPSDTVFDSAQDNGAYNSSTNAVTWNIGSLAPGSSITVSYRVKVSQAPAGTVIVNTALLRAQGISDVISNETRTRIAARPVAAPVRQPGAPVRAVAGANSLASNFLYSAFASILFLAALYFGLRYTDGLRMLKLKLAVFKIRFKEGI